MYRFEKPAERVGVRPGSRCLPKSNCAAGFTAACENCKRPSSCIAGKEPIRESRTRRLQRFNIIYTDEEEGGSRAT